MRVLALRPSTSMLTEDLTCVPPCPPLHVLCDPRCPTCPLLLPVAPWSDHQDPGQSASQLPSAHMHSVSCPQAGLSSSMVAPLTHSVTSDMLCKHISR